MTVKEQAAIFMTQIQTRKRNPVKQSTADVYKSHLDKWILPLLGNEQLSQIENGVVKTFIQKLFEASLSSATINGIICVIKMIVASAVDQNGNQLYPRTWNSEFIDLPTIQSSKQNTPTATPQSIQEALRRTKGQERALYALLAGSGLRVGEALALKVGPDNGQDSYWAPETGTITVRTTRALHAGGIQLTPKTEAGIRQVDLSQALNVFLRQNLTGTVGLLFKNQSGGAVRFNTLREHAEEAGIDPRFHSFRRFRVTHLRNAGVPEGLIQFWAGHAGESITDRYDKIGTDVEARRSWAEKAGLGFQLEAK